MPEGDWYSDVYDSGEDHSWFALMDSRDHLIAGAANVVMPLRRTARTSCSRTPGGVTALPVLATYGADGRCWAYTSTCSSRSRRTIPA